MHTAGELFAESAHEEPRVHEAWLSSAARSAGGSAASAWAGGGSAAQSLEEHMLAHMNGLGPKTFQVLCVCHLAAASVPQLERSALCNALGLMPALLRAAGCPLPRSCRSSLGISRSGLGFALNPKTVNPRYKASILFGYFGFYGRVGL